MARNAADVLVKKNNKLEAFLKKTLDADTFEKIRAYDSCIVCSEKEDKAFKYVVITDDWVYLTENPPKKVHEAVHLSDVVAVELLNEFPDFLQGEERENTQHIVIKYLTKQRKGSKKNKNGSKSSRSDSKSLTGSGSIPNFHALSARNSIAVDRLAYSAREPSSRSKDLRQLTSRSLPEKQVQFGTKSTTGNLLTVPGQNGPTHVRTKSADKLLRAEKLRTKSLDASTLKKALEGVNKKKKLSASYSGGSTESITNNLASTMQNRYTSSKFDKVRDLPRRLPNPTEEWDENGKPIDKRTKEPSRLSFSGSGEFKLANGRHGDTQSEEEESEDEEDSEDGEITLTVPPLNLKKSSNGSEEEEEDDSVEEVDTSRSGCGPCGKKKKYSPNPEDTLTPLLLDNGQLAWTTSTLETTLGPDDVFESENGEKKRIAELHLYIVHFSSPILMLTRCAWNNYLIRATLEVDPEVSLKREVFGAQKPKGTSEKLELLFSQLRNELMNSTNTLEDTFDLVSELKSAAERTFAIKKLFWKNSEMFTFIVRQLQKYLPKSPHCQGLSSEEAKTQRADEFELLILLVETLGVMFRETETLPSRFPTLKSGKGKATLDLIVVLTCCAELPLQKSSMKSYADVELAKLVEEYTNVSASVLYEIILIAHQANWGDTYGSFFNICWLVKVLDELNTTEQYVEHIVCEAMRLISPSRHEELSPPDAVLVFMLFTIIQTLLEYSPKCTDFIRTNFYEEFKYYIQAPIILQKLPKKYLIRKYAIRLIQECMSVILQRKVKLVSEAEL